MTDYREDGMDLGSDPCSRASSESSSNKVTPCSEYKSSPSLDLATLGDYEEDEDYQEYKKKVIEEWENEYGDYSENNGFVKASSRSLAQEFQEVKVIPPVPSIVTTGEMKQNGNIAPTKRSGKENKTLPKLQKALQITSGSVAMKQLETSGTFVTEEAQLPTMDWEALEKHLAGLQFQEQEAQNQNQSQTKTNFTSHADEMAVVQCP
ncbi:schwannomin-interacting protein 1-like [Rhincodon typus]|uniref:schwannomin-interacting protein 1-like n=1 Tax=Rhincodon typus TaxID=259920 RepID=UPI00202E3E71|nr:schwannomin-interacting protein 1-like [Rhincodon typus]